MFSWGLLVFMNHSSTRRGAYQVVSMFPLGICMCWFVFDHVKPT
ncbi:hypothetical protein ES288_A11G058000v1 [Gossypium darwinii]|uniref:Uncharacterized protein n=2 Tax=Gossypium TaxID=3633 RepID=A0A5D2N7B5_GOSTO|nr:hypothetical protein ES288_A11G058000v1 [Gossypium darwinii]TYH99323.1 hypothetical protein ES332_A11G058400v1 [Gossypium tomentosum]